MWNSIRRCEILWIFRREIFAVSFQVQTPRKSFQTLLWSELRPSLLLVTNKRSDYRHTTAARPTVFRTHSCSLCNANVGCCYSPRLKEDATRHCTWRCAWLAPDLFHIFCSTVFPLRQPGVEIYIQWSSSHHRSFKKLQSAPQLPFFFILLTTLL